MLSLFVIIVEEKNLSMRKFLFHTRKIFILSTDYFFYFEKKTFAKKAISGDMCSSEKATQSDTEKVFFLVSHSLYNTPQNLNLVAKILYSRDFLPARRKRKIVK
jgi:hypothetical protein